MRKTQLGMGAAAALALTLAACGGTDEPANDIAADEVNAMTNVEDLPPAEPAANEIVETPAVAEPQPEPVAERPAPPAKPAPAPAKPKTTEPKPAESNAAAPTCSPEHRAAGHC
jgi:outer membrane biosynthesis protein TonB